MTQPEWRRLADYINARMDEIGISQAELIRRSASLPTVRALMEGAPRGMPRKATLHKVSRGLGWTPDSIERILAGGKPKLAAPLEPAPEVSVKLAELERLLDGVSARLDVLADNQAELFDMAHRHGERRSGDAEPAAL